MSSGSFASFSINSNRSERMAFSSATRAALPCFSASSNVGQGDGIEVIIRQRDEAKSETPQLHDLLDHDIRRTLARLLAVGSPHRTERTMLRAAAHRLHGGPHITIARGKVPARRQEMHLPKSFRRHKSAGPCRCTRSAITFAQTTSPSPLTTTWAPPSSRASSGYKVA